MQWLIAVPIQVTPRDLWWVLTVLLILYLSVYSLDGVLVLALLIICTCAYITKVPRLKSFFLSEKKGFFGVFYKGKTYYSCTTFSVELHVMATLLMPTIQPIIHYYSYSQSFPTFLNSFLIDIVIEISFSWLLKQPFPLKIQL